MQIGDRIARRRKELHLTQDELAERMGYKSKAAISKIETNVNDITQSTVVKFASVLDTSVAYLMGWEETAANPSESSDETLSTEEVHLINLYRLADEIDRATIQNILSRYDEEATAGQHSAG